MALLQWKRVLECDEIVLSIAIGVNTYLRIDHKSFKK